MTKRGSSGAWEACGLVTSLDFLGVCANLKEGFGHTNLRQYSPSDIHLSLWGKKTERKKKRNAMIIVIYNSCRHLFNIFYMSGSCQWFHKYNV
jgi:hypothetical protein